ncbi:hypothetical protein SAMN05216230_106189 [Pseudomonas soli]|uniref:Uncharacterized protein n=1 Tax=Pseudomonas soli TaxID=1306993 RepID=A0A1H9MEW2_9PSED|nr:hypothetical protein SAMN05216230_106189 [Pseudomonas soli]
MSVWQNVLPPGPSPFLSSQIYTPSDDIWRYVRSQAVVAGFRNLWIDANRNMFPAR